jgi:hypothetical protein
MKAPLIDRINDHIADSARWFGPILILLGLAGVVASVVMHLWK